MRYATGLHQPVRDLFLSYDAGGILSTNSNSSQTRVCALEAVLHLVQTTLWGEDGNVMIIVSGQQQQKELSGAITRTLGLYLRTYESRLMIVYVWTFSRRGTLVEWLGDGFLTKGAVPEATTTESMISSH